MKTPDFTLLQMISAFICERNHEESTNCSPAALLFLFLSSLSLKCLILLKDLHFHNEQAVITYHSLCWDSSPPEYFKPRRLLRTPFSFPLSITLLTWLLNRNCQITTNFQERYLKQVISFYFFLPHRSSVWHVRWRVRSTETRHISCWWTKLHCCIYIILGRKKSLRSLLLSRRHGNYTFMML